MERVRTIRRDKQRVRTPSKMTPTIPRMLAFLAAPSLLLLDFLSRLGVRTRRRGVPMVPFRGVFLGVVDAMVEDDGIVLCFVGVVV